MTHEAVHPPAAVNVNDRVLAANARTNLGIGEP